MNKEQLEQEVKDKLSTYSIAEKYNISQTTVRYWLKKHNLKASRPRAAPGTDNHLCEVCGDTNSVNFYPRKKSKCKLHANAQRNETFVNNAILVKREYGGKCCLCGYDKCLSALEFHHTDPRNKSKGYSTQKNWTLDRRRVELEKCILICANCHREIHSGLRNMDGTPKTSESQP